MLAEFVKALTDLALRSRATYTKQLGDTELLLSPDGELLQQFDKPADGEGWEFETVEDLANWTTQRGGGALVGFCDGILSAVMQRGLHAQSVGRVVLAPTDAWGFLSSLARKPMPVTPSDIRRLTAQMDLGAAGEGIASTLMQIEFFSTSRQAATPQTSTLGRSVEAAVGNQNRLPTAFECSVPVWRDAALGNLFAIVPIRVLITPEQERVELFVRSTELDRAFSLASEKAREVMQNMFTDVVYRGRLLT